MALIRKKLVFDVTFSNASPGQVKRFRCTNGATTLAAATILTHDRYGGVLQDMAPLTRGSPLDALRRNSVSAFYQPYRRLSAVVTRGFKIGVQFISLLTGGGLIPNAAQTIPNGNIVPTGGDSVFSRHFAVQLDISDISGAGDFTETGALYVQRQHSIEV